MTARWTKSSAARTLPQAKSEYEGVIQVQVERPLDNANQIKYLLMSMFRLDRRITSQYPRAADKPEFTFRNAQFID